MEQQNDNSSKENESVGCLLVVTLYAGGVVLENNIRVLVKKQNYDVNDPSNKSSGNARTVNDYKTKPKDYILPTQYNLHLDYSQT